MRAELKKKIAQSIRLLQSTTKGRGKVDVSYSGGKDSDVILQLCKEAGIDFRVVYKNTTIDPSGTIKHAMEVGAVVLNPKRTFFQIIKEKGYPTRWSRFCCEELKEYYTNDTVVIGIRKEESAKRKSRYKEPTQCRVYSKKNDIKAYQIMPILEWTSRDVKEYIEDRAIKCHDLYYDSRGNFHAERRLGCQGCPLISRQKRVEFFRKNPKWLKAWLRAGEKYYDGRRYNQYEQMVMALFYDTTKDFDIAINGMFGKPDCKKILEEYFNIEL